MIVLFYIFLILVILHFVWDGIIAPSIRLEIRYELFEMRDKLRRLKIQLHDQFNDELFNLLQHILNNELAFLHRARIVDFYRAYKKYGNSKSLQLTFENFQRLVNECSIEDVRKLWERTGLITVCALVVNS